MNYGKMALIGVLAIGAFGCSNNKELIAHQQMEITALQAQLTGLEGELEQERIRAERLNNQLEMALADYAGKEQVLLDRIAERSIVTVSDAALFRSGSTNLTDVGRDILTRIGEVIDLYPDREVLVEGHTDDVKIAAQFRSKYNSNWELSSARAHSALHYLKDKMEVPPSRMAAVGYGEYRPVAANETNEGRAANRRVVIVIGPSMNSAPAPDQAPQSDMQKPLS